MVKLHSEKTFIATRIFLAIGTLSLITDLWLYGSNSYFQITHEGLFSLALSLLILLFFISYSIKENVTRRKAVRQINFAGSILSVLLTTIFVISIINGILIGEFQFFRINSISFWIFLTSKIVSIFIVAFEGANNPRVKNIFWFAMLAFFYSFICSIDFLFSINLNNWLSIIILMVLPLSILFLNINRIRILIEESILSHKTATHLTKELSQMFDMQYRNSVFIRDFVVNPREGNTPTYAVSLHIGENEIEEVENILSNTKQFLKNKGIQHVVIESYLSDKQQINKI